VGFGGGDSIFMSLGWGRVVPALGPWGLLLLVGSLTASTLGLALRRTHAVR
jgi:hypothetical protein